MRAFADGDVIGATKSETSKLFVNPQSWAILGEMVSEDRLERILKAFDEKIEMELGCPVNIPPFYKYDPRIGRISAQESGGGENGGIYCHATSFKVAADVKVGRGDAALRNLHKIMPDYEKNPAEKSGAAPYAMTSSFSIRPQTYGNAGRPWLTGTSSWFMHTVVEGLLGVRREYGGFRISPAFPSSWEKANMTLKRGNAEYRFRIERSNAQDLDTPEITLDGEKLKTNLLPFQDEGVHEVLIRV